VAEGLTSSLDRGDQAAFLAQFTPDGPTQRLGERWYDNLAQFQAVTVVPGFGGALVVTSSVPGDTSLVTQTVGVDVDTSGGSALIAGVVPSTDTPDWVLSSVTVTSTPAGSLITDAGVPDAQRSAFTGAMAKAVASLTGTDLGTLDGAWNGQLVLDVPRDSVGYTHAGGNPTASEAITTCAAGSIRVVVNPVALGYPADQIGPLVVHEAVHVATNACVAQYRPWVIEGLAESVTAAAFPAVASDNHAAVKDYLAAHGMPSALPDERDFAAAPASQRAFYALAQVAVDATFSHLGRADAAALLATITGPTSATPASAEARVTTWYLDALRAW